MSASSPPTSTSRAPMDVETDVLIVGSGMIGMATPRSLLEQGRAGGAGCVDAEPAAGRRSTGYDGDPRPWPSLAARRFAQLGRLGEAWRRRPGPSSTCASPTAGPRRPAAPWLHYDHRGSASARPSAVCREPGDPPGARGPPGRAAPGDGRGARTPCRGRARAGPCGGAAAGRKAQPRRLLVAADGARSKLRQEAGIAAATGLWPDRHRGDHDRELSHGRIAHEHFLPRPLRHAAHDRSCHAGSGGPATLLHGLDPRALTPACSPCRIRRPAERSSAGFEPQPRPEFKILRPHFVLVRCAYVRATAVPISRSSCSSAIRPHAHGFPSPARA